MEAVAASKAAKWAKNHYIYKEYAHDYVGIWGQCIQMLGQISEAVLRLPKSSRNLLPLLTQVYRAIALLFHSLLIEFRVH